MKPPINSRRETSRSIGKHKTKYACIVQSVRIRLEGVRFRYRGYHIAAKGLNSLDHCNLVHTFIPMPRVIKKNWMQRQQWKNNGKIGENTSMAADGSQKQEVIDEARNRGRKVHLASLLDLCHLKNSDLEPQFQKYKGRVVLRGDIVKDDSGSYAVFTEQGSSASQMTAARVMDII